MATKAKSNEEPEPEAQVEEPERVVDPPEATAEEVKDVESAGAEHQWVQVEQSGILTLPSGMSFNLNAGNVLQLSSEDAAFIIDQGYGSEMDAPSEE